MLQLIQTKLQLIDLKLRLFHLQLAHQGALDAVVLVPADQLVAHPHEGGVACAALRRTAREEDAHTLCQPIVLCHVSIIYSTSTKICFITFYLPIANQ